MLAGVLSGGRFGNLLGEGSYAQFFLTIDVERYLPLDQFKARMDQLIDQIHQSPPRPEVDQIYLAGEAKHALQTQRLRDGIPIEAAVLAELEQVEQSLGV